MVLLSIAGNLPPLGTRQSCLITLATGNRGCHVICLHFAGWLLIGRLVLHPAFESAVILDGATKASVEAQPAAHEEDGSASENN